MIAEEASASTRPRRAAAFGFIYASSLLNSISFGIMIPILPNLIKRMTGGDTAAAADWAVLFAITWGRCSSSAGRCSACSPTASAAGR